MIHRIKSGVPWVLIFLLIISVYSQTKIEGFVLNKKGQPLSYVNIFLKSSLEGDVSDSTGYFEILTNKTGQQFLIASMIGYERFIKMVELKAKDTLFIKIVLKEKALSMPETIVTASSFTSGDETGVTLSSLDVVTTPGAAADIFRALKTFPGLAQVDEGSGLFVRGGDFSETVILLDQATLVHPYRFESPTGGIFGTIPPFLLKGTFFSTGGFSAKYGNALSGILAMQSLDAPKQRSYNLNFGLAAISAGLALPLKPGKLGIRFSGNKSNTRLMFRVNGQNNDFVKYPSGSDMNININYQYSSTGHLKFFLFAEENQVGIKIPQPSFSGLFSSDDQNQFYNLQWTDLFSGNWLMQASLSFNAYRTRRSLGILDFQQKDQTYKFRLDGEKSFNHNFTLDFGMEREWSRNQFKGQFPASEVLDPNAEALSINDKFEAIRMGGYLEGEVKFPPKVSSKMGLRVDHNNLSAQAVLDPRVSLYYRISDRSMVRASWGVYHQFPTPLHYSPGYGNPQLVAQRAIHYILGYEYNVPHTLARIEIYYKDYDNLVIEDNELNFTNEGYGYARGVDVFFKQGELIKNKLSGWLSYSFLQSRRLQSRNLINQQVKELAPSPFDITHNFTIVGKYSLSSRLTLGLSYRYATGRPITPVIDAQRQPGFDFYLPVEGPVGSERLPSYQRFDSNLSYQLPFQKNFMVLYFAVSNLLNRKNVLDYDYSQDYQQRKPRKTNYSRFFYFGIVVNFQ